MSTTALIINVLIAYGACQAFFIAIILFKSKQTIFKKLFATLLIIEGITLFERLLVETDLIIHVPHFLGISHPISFLKPPLLLFMAMTITIPNYKFSKRDYCHLIGFGLMFLLNLPFYFLSGSEKIEMIAVFMTKVPSYASFEFYFTLSFFFYMGIYIYTSIRKLYEFKEQVTNNSLVNWVYILLIIYSGFLIFHLIYFLIQPLGGYNFALFNQISMLATTFIIQAIAFKIIDKSTIFNNKPPNFEELQRRKRYENAIISQFTDHRIYLNDNLNLTIFSESVELPPSYVSEIINQKYNCSFKKLVNQYRLQEAKKRIKEAKHQKIKLIDIAFESGFNNKVSFYRAFKEFEGVSPSDYLEKLKKM